MLFSISHETLVNFVNNLRQTQLNKLTNELRHHNRGFGIISQHDTDRENVSTANYLGIKWQQNFATL